MCRCRSKPVIGFIEYLTSLRNRRPKIRDRFCCIVRQQSPDGASSRTIARNNLPLSNYNSAIANVIKSKDAMSMDSQYILGFTTNRVIEPLERALCSGRRSNDVDKISILHIKVQGRSRGCVPLLRLILDAKTAPKPFPGRCCSRRHLDKCRQNGPRVLPAY